MDTDNKDYEEFAGRNGGTLRKLQPGCAPRNPNGKPVGSKNTKTLIREMLNQVTDVYDEITGLTVPMTLQQQMVAAQIKRAIQGMDTIAFNAIHDRMEGKPTQEIEQKISHHTVVIDTTGNEDNPVHEEASGG